MFIITICVPLVAAFLLCWLFIFSKWRKYGWLYSEPSIQSLRSYNILSRVWPCDNGFMSLVFSALRHTVLAGVAAALIWFVNIQTLNTALTLGTLLYAYLVVSRYNVRRKDYKTAEHCKDLLKPVKSACFSVVLLSFFDYLIVMLSYGLRP